MKRSIINLDKQIELLHKRKDRIQYNCTHKNKKVERDYSNHTDLNKCPDCGRVWYEEWYRHS